MFNTAAGRHINIKLDFRITLVKHIAHAWRSSLEVFNRISKTTSIDIY
jgi:hypothetical protein